MKNAYNIVLGDWFNPPVIQRVGRYGAAIRIWVTDDVHVAGVQVLVLDEEEKMVEKGRCDSGQGRLVGICAECRGQSGCGGAGFGGE